MSRIKKQGLDYFPMDIDFTRKPLVRRIMKKEGEGAATVLIDTLCAIYAAEGYYVVADELFYDDLASGYYERTATDVERIIHLALEYKLFSQAMFDEHGILTSPDVQRQFLYSTRRRVGAQVLPQYSLLDQSELEEEKPKKRSRSAKPKCEDATSMPQNATEKAEMETETPKNATFIPHSTAQHSTAQHSIAEQKQPPHIPQALGEAEEEGSDASPQTTKRRTETIPADLSLLRPPADGLKRNYEGLLHSMRQLHIPPADQYAIVRLSNYGVIGHPVWKGLSTLRSCGGKIKLPGRYLLSLR